MDGESCFVEGFGEIRGLKRNARNVVNTLWVGGKRKDNGGRAADSVI